MLLLLFVFQGVVVATGPDGVAMMQRVVNVHETHAADGHPRLDVPDTLQALLESVQGMPDDPTSLPPVMKQLLHTPQLMSDFRHILTSGLKWARHNPMTKAGVPQEAELHAYTHMKKMQSDLEHLQEQGGTASLLERLQLALEDPTMKARVPRELRKFYQDPEMRARMADVLFQGLRQGQKVWAQSPGVQRNLALYGKATPMAQGSHLTKDAFNEWMKHVPQVVNWTLPKFYGILKDALARPSLLQVGKQEPDTYDVGDIDTVNQGSGQLRQSLTNKILGTGHGGCDYSDTFTIGTFIVMQTAFGTDGYKCEVLPLLHFHLLPIPPEDPSLWKYGVGTMPFGTTFEFKFPSNYLGKGCGIDYVGAGVTFPGDKSDARCSLGAKKNPGVVVVSTYIELKAGSSRYGSLMAFYTLSGLSFQLPYGARIDGDANWGWLQPLKGNRYVFDISPSLAVWTPPYYIGRKTFVTKAMSYIYFGFSQQGGLVYLGNNFIIDSAPHDHRLAGAVGDDAMACWGYAKETPAPVPPKRAPSTEEKKAADAAAAPSDSYRSEYKSFQEVTDGNPSVLPKAFNDKVDADTFKDNWKSGALKKWLTLDGPDRLSDEEADSLFDPKKPQLKKENVELKDKTPPILKASTAGTA